MQNRRDHNRLGFAYQLAFVRLAIQFSTQQPMELAYRNATPEMSK